MSTLAIVSLIVFIAFIVFGVVTKTHLGAIGIVGAFILGLFVLNNSGSPISSGSAAKGLFSLTDYSLWFTIIGVSVLCRIAQNDGTLDNLVGKLCYRVGPHKWVFPFVIFVIYSALSMSGLGGLNLTPILVPLLVVISDKENLPFPILAAAAHGACGVGFAPVAQMGVLLNNLMDENGIPHAAGYWTNALITGIIVGVFNLILAFIVFGGLKMKADKDKISVLNKPEKLSSNQWITIIGLLAFVAMVLGLGWAPGPSGLIVAIILCIIKKLEIVDLYKGVPWPTLLLIGGMSIFAAVVKQAGGIDLVVNGLVSLAGNNGRLAGYFLQVAGGCLSLVTSTMGVVMPTFIPMASGIAAATGANATWLATCASFGGLLTGITPLSVTGGLYLGIYSTRHSKEEVAKLFGQLFLLGALMELGGLISNIIGLWNFGL